MAEAKILTELWRKKKVGVSVKWLWVFPKIQILTFLLVFLFALGNMSSAREYPIKEVTGKFCGTSQMCTIPLPRIEKARYLDYVRNPLIRRVYSVLRGGTYFGGRDFGRGAHKGVDITSQMGTDIYAIGTGEVIFAGKKGEWWNLVTIAHDFAGKKIYSNYAHLSEILVKVWDKVQTSTLIAKMGSTGNSTGPHLHFQIDKSEGKHPYHPGNCWGVTLNQNVNEARCWNLVKEHTLDPIVFLESDGAVFEAAQEQGDFDSEMKIMTDEEVKKNMEVRFERRGEFGILSIKSKVPWWTRVPMHFSATGARFFPESISDLNGERKVLVQGATEALFPMSIWMEDNLIKNIYDK